MLTDWPCSQMSSV